MRIETTRRPTRTNHPLPLNQSAPRRKRAALTRIYRMRAIHATRFIADATPRAVHPARASSNGREAGAFSTRHHAASGDDDGRASTDDSSDASASSRGLDGGKYGMGERIDRALDATTNQLGFVAWAASCCAIDGRVVHVRTSTSDGVLVHRRGRMWSVGVL